MYIHIIIMLIHTLTFTCTLTLIHTHTCILFVTTHTLYITGILLYSWYINSGYSDSSSHHRGRVSHCPTRSLRSIS